MNLWKRLRTYHHYKRIERKMLAKQELHAKMSYVEIEAEISNAYRKAYHCELNWDNPQSYNEKINVSKLYMPTQLKTKLADKYLAREWLKEKVGEEYIVPLIGVYDSFDEIEFDKLPDKFVIKCNHDCSSTTLCEDKNKLDLLTLKYKYDIFMKRNFAYVAWEMHYRDIVPKIIIEKYLGNPVNDY